MPISSLSMMCLCASMTCSAELRSIRGNRRSDGWSARPRESGRREGESTNRRSATISVAQRRLRQVFLCSACARACSFGNQVAVAVLRNGSLGRLGRSPRFVRFGAEHDLICSKKTPFQQLVGGLPHLGFDGDESWFDLAYTLAAMVAPWWSTAKYSQIQMKEIEFE